MTDYLIWRFRCPNCGVIFDMRERDYDTIPDLIEEDFVCPGEEEFFNGQYAMSAKPCGHKFTVTKNMLYSVPRRSWGYLDAFVEGLLRP